MTRTTNQLLIAISLVFLFCAPQTFAQTLPQVCNESSGLAWDMNTEADMQGYKVHYSNAANVNVGGVGVQVIDVAHDPSAATDNGDGTFTVVHQLTLTQEGDTYFVVTACDTSGNCSPKSNEAACNINMSPGTPTIQLRFNLASP